MSGSPAISAVLFDVDGTLLDTREFISGAFDHSLRLHSIDPAQARERWLTVAGRDLTFIYSHLCPQADPAILCETHRRFQMDNMHLVKIFPGVRELLVKLQNSGIALAAVTSRNRDTVATSLQLHLLYDLFDQIICADEVVFTKPHPEPLLTVLRNMKKEAGSAVMVGDSRFDVEAGKAAGTKTIGVIYGLDGPAIRDSQPDFVVSSIDDLSQILSSWLN